MVASLSWSTRRLRTFFSKVLPFPAGTADLVGKLGSDSNQPRPRCDKRAGQHAVVSLHTHLTKEPDFRELRQTIGVVRVRLIRRHIERRFSMARIDADRR